VLRSYRYHLYPTKTQRITLTLWLELLRELYNSALQERRDAWNKQRVSISYFDQCHELIEVRKILPEFSAVPSIVLRGTLKRLDSSFQKFFQRCKLKKTPGYPRFKNKNRFKTLHINDLTKGISINNSRVTIPFIGLIKFKYHRILEGTPKSIRITQDARGRWFIVFSCANVLTKPLPTLNNDVGIDLGLRTFVATSSGEKFENPKCFKHAELKLKRKQRAISRCKDGSTRKQKLIKSLAIYHEHIKNMRREQHIQIAKVLVAFHDTIYVEDLNIKTLVENQPRMAKQIYDASWGKFLYWLNVKAEEAERKVIKVNPRYTSQICSKCGHKTHKELCDRVHNCTVCGLILDRDVNAAKNILQLGKNCRGGALTYQTPKIRKELGATPEHTMVESIHYPNSKTTSTVAN